MTTSEAGERSPLAAERIAERLKSVPDLPLRVRFLDHHCTQLSAEELAIAYRGLVHGADRLPGFSAAQLAFSLALANPRHNGRRTEAAIWATQSNDILLACMLRPTDDMPFHQQRPAPQDSRGRPLTLGEQKSLARSRDRGLLAKALRQGQPEVVPILLSNPAIVELDIVRLAAQRPIPSEVLRAIFAHHRWIVRPAVRSAVMQNPSCPLDIALQLSPQLNQTDAKQMALSPSLRPMLRHACGLRAQAPTYQ